MQITLLELLKKTADHAVKKQLDSGAFPAGHNGPYKDPETPVRNTSHWIMTLCYLLKNDPQPRYEESLEKGLNYMLSKQVRPMDATFWCRSNPEKDFSNGLVGQAWAIEALMRAYSITGQEKLKSLAKEIFVLHPYDDSLKMWRIVNVDGTYDQIDPTYNHQLWFAYVGSLLAEDESILLQVESFLTKTAKKLALFKDGTLKHLQPFFFASNKKDELKQIARMLMYKQMRPSSQYIKSVGYHGFNLLAFSQLKQALPEHALWSSGLIKEMIEPIYAQSFWTKIDSSPYAYPYNPPGIEMAVAAERFRADNEKVKSLLEVQFQKTMDTKNWMMSIESPDTETSSARIYEATFLENDYQLSL